MCGVNGNNINNYYSQNGRAWPCNVRRTCCTVLYRTVLCGQQMYESGVWERARIDYGSNWRYEINPNYFCVCVCVHVRMYTCMYAWLEWNMEWNVSGLKIDTAVI